MCRSGDGYTIHLGHLRNTIWFHTHLQVFPMAMALHLVLLLHLFQCHEFKFGVLNA